MVRQTTGKHLSRLRLCWRSLSPAPVFPGAWGSLSRPSGLQVCGPSFVALVVYLARSAHTARLPINFPSVAIKSTFARRSTSPCPIAPLRNTVAVPISLKYFIEPFVLSTCSVPLQTVDRRGAHFVSSLQVPSTHVADQFRSTFLRRLHDAGDHHPFHLKNTFSFTFVHIHFHSAFHN